MAIIVNVALLLALAMMMYKKRLINKKYRIIVNIGIGFIAFSGLWNSAWYGVQNVPFFWGFTALFSGFFMLASALTLYLETKDSKLILSCSYSAFRLAVMIGLSLYFILYLVTIVQINLGLPIIQ